ncbi:ATPase [Candidatus Micrarchaeota archaeon]|nr:ATPase [Candidatus Micrarchaeota archaeon]
MGMGLVALGAGIAIAGSAFATAWSQAAIGSALMGLLAEKDHPMALIFLALPETIVLLGFIVAYMLITSLGG